VVRDLVVVPEPIFNLNMTPDHTLLLRIYRPHPFISFQLPCQLDQRVRSETYRRSSSEEEQSGRFLAQRWNVSSTVLVP
jgi:hypothetical protein